MSCGCLLGVLLSLSVQQTNYLQAPTPPAPPRPPATPPLRGSHAGHTGSPGAAELPRCALHCAPLHAQTCLAVRKPTPPHKAGWGGGKATRAKPKQRGMYLAPSATRKRNCMCMSVEEVQDEASTAPLHSRCICRHGAPPSVAGGPLLMSTTEMQSRDRHDR
jgi:hypothetical protein